MHAENGRRSSRNGDSGSTRTRVSPASRETEYREAFLKWLSGLDTPTELGPFVARWMFMAFDHQIQETEGDTWEEFLTRKVRGHLPGTYWVVVLNGEKDIEAELVKTFTSDLEEAEADFGVIVSPRPFSTDILKLYEENAQIMLMGPQDFLKKFGGMLYHRDGWDAMLRKSQQDMENMQEVQSQLEQIEVVATAQPQHGGKRRRRRGGGGGFRPRPQAQGV